jgi:hypothetical protein
MEAHHNNTFLGEQQKTLFQAWVKETLGPVVCWSFA